jgi:hypothetical protein
VVEVVDLLLSGLLAEDPACRKNTITMTMKITTTACSTRTPT